MYGGTRRLGLAIPHRYVGKESKVQASGRLAGCTGQEESLQVAVYSVGDAQEGMVGCGWVLWLGVVGCYGQVWSGVVRCGRVWLCVVVCGRRHQLGQ